MAEILVEVSGQLHYGPPKTKAGRRGVPLPRIAIDALNEHLQTFPAAPDDLVFRSPDGDATRLSNWRHRVWEPAVTSAGLAHLRPHDLRHTAVALWIAAGASPREIAARAGRQFRCHGSRSIRAPVPRLRRQGERRPRCPGRSRSNFKHCHGHRLNPLCHARVMLAGSEYRLSSNLPSDLDFSSGR